MVSYRLRPISFASAQYFKYKDELCVVQAIECVFKLERSIDKIKATSLEELVTVKVLERIQHGKSDLDITNQLR